MPTLYVTTPGARVEKEYRRLIVAKDDELIFRIPLFRVDQIVLVGSVGVTTPALQALLREGVGLTLISRSGKLLGRLVPPTLKNIALRQKQYHCGQAPDFCLEVSKAFITGKVRNAGVIVSRLRRRHEGIAPDISDKLHTIRRQINTAKDLAILRGLEGRAARLYFLAFRQSLREDWDFGRRTHHPPKDQVNALLGLAYTLLHENMITALEVVGLDPYEGFLHADKYGRPALALDIMEEFRHIIADSVVMRLVNKKILTPDDFATEGKGYCLKHHALAKFFRDYQHRIQTEVKHPTFGKKLSYQKCFEVQARQLRKVIEGQVKVYQPFITR
jgi:CRISPR-associated protein Cas1